MAAKSGYDLVKALMVLGDFICLNMIFGIVYYLYYVRSGYETDNLNLVWLLLNISYIIVVMAFSKVHTQRIIYADRLISKASQSVFLHALLFIFFLVFLKDRGLSNSFLLLFYVVFACTLNIWWLVSRKVMKMYRKRGYNFIRTIIVGAGKNGMKLYDEMQSDLGYGYKIMGFFDDNETLRESLPLYKGDVSQVEHFVLEYHVDEVYCALPSSQDEKINRLMNFAEHNAVRFFIVPEISRCVFRRLHYQMVGNMPTLSIRPEPLENVFYRELKRLFDVIFSLCFLLFFPVIFVPVATAVKISSPGPVFFRQRRTGLKGKDFWCYKFRTMRVNGDCDKVQATKDDPRKTRVGEFLRKTNLDELPQFINVLKGDMSVVGPRPHMLKHTEDYSALIDKYMVRHLVKPGITGWAQVNGFRGETRELKLMEKRIQYDIWYIENWNFWLDIKIIVLTLYNIVKGDKNAF